MSPTSGDHHFRKIHGDPAFTGLEASIVLIAFVVVAAIFGYTMLGAGMFSSQKNQETSASSVKQSTSNVILDGYMYGSYSGQLQALNFNIKVPLGNEPAKTSDIVFFYGKNNGVPRVITPTFASSNSILQPGNAAKVTLHNLQGPTAGQPFTLEIKPKAGASIMVKRVLSDGYTGGLIVTA